MRVSWSPLADEQVDEVVAYIAADDQAAALTWLEQLLERVASLARFPDSGRIVPELQRDDLRELVDGEKLVNMLEELELGLKPVRAYQIDQSFFDEFKD